MNNEDEEFNRIEREAKQRIEAVKETIRYRDAFPKDYRLPKPWVGLTDDERRGVRNSVGYNQLVTAGEYAEHVQKATEFLLKEKNGM
jgi:hypothetical protein